MSVLKDIDSAMSMKKLARQFFVFIARKIFQLVTVLLMNQNILI